MIKALFFLLDGESNASSRHRVLQYLPFLRAHGIEPCISRPVPEPIYQRLVERNGSKSQLTKTAFYALFLATRLRDILRADRFDAVAIQRDLFPFGPPLLERMLFARNPRVQYDSDDATYLRPIFTPNTPFQRLRRFDKVSEVVSRARSVTVATEPIARWARQFSPNVRVVPMAVDLREYESLGPRVRPAESLIIGWAGTAGGLEYLHALGPVLKEVAAKHHVVVRVISGGYRRVVLPGVPLDTRPWRARTLLQDMSEFDIGLVPLADTPFEHAKFPFKLLQYMALGLPAVAAGVGVARSVIRDRENGLLAGSLDEWREALEALIGDASLRQRIGAAGRETVAENYVVERTAPLVVQSVIDAAQK